MRNCLLNGGFHYFKSLQNLLFCRFFTTKKSVSSKIFTKSGFFTIFTFTKSALYCTLIFKCCNYLKKCSLLDVVIGKLPPTVDILRNPLIFTFTLLTFVTLSLKKLLLNEKQIWIESRKGGGERRVHRKVSYEGHKKVWNIHNFMTRNLLIYCNSQKWMTGNLFEFLRRNSTVDSTCNFDIFDLKLEQKWCNKIFVPKIFLSSLRFD